jgi:hypothetical protein
MLYFPKSKKIVERIKAFVQDSCKPNFVVAYGDVTGTLEMMCKFMGIRTFVY